MISPTLSLAQVEAYFRAGHVSRAEVIAYLRTWNAGPHFTQAVLWGDSIINYDVDKRRLPREVEQECGVRRRLARSRALLERLIDSVINRRLRRDENRYRHTVPAYSNGREVARRMPERLHRHHYPVATLEVAPAESSTFKQSDINRLSLRTDMV